MTGRETNVWRYTFGEGDWSLTLDRGCSRVGATTRSGMVAPTY